MKVFAFDIDGTLITTTHEIQQSTLDVLRDIEQNGDRWLLVTGRNYDIVTPLLSHYSLHCDCILNSGHQFIDASGNELLKVPMSNTVLRKVLQILQRYEYHISVHTDKGKYIFMEKEEYFNKHMEISRKKHKDKLQLMQHSPFVRKDLFLYNTHSVTSIDELLDSGARVLKIDARNFNQNQVQMSLEALHQLEEIVIHSSYEAFLEISEKTSNKALMLEKVIKDYGVSKEDTYVFGDSMNDIELFQRFPNSIAMDNAKPIIKNLAKHITKSNNEDGISYAYYELLKED